MFIRNCPECGKDISYKGKKGLDRANRRNAKCRPCSKKGEKNPSYGKAPSKESRRKMSIGNGGSGELNCKWPGLRAWANRVKERDEYVCQHCNYDGLPEEMDAHHIVPKSKFPRYAYDLDNGQTLCKECHMYVHKHYG